jgi:hypothetical protein
MAISSHDIVPDSPTNTFATLNPLRAGTQNLADGNLKISAKSENHWGTLAVDPADTNKYYFEMLVIAQKAGAQVVGVSNQSGTATNYLGSDANGWGIFFQSNSNNGDLVNSTLSSSGVTFSNGDIVQVCFTASKIWFGKNGTFIGNPDTETSPSFSNLSGTLSPVISNRSDLGGSACINFGQDHLFGGSTFSTAATNAGAGSNTPDNGIGTFAFSPPTGALALCTANLPDPAIDPAVDDLLEDYFKAVTWTGNTNGGSYNNGYVTVGFQADLIWIKNRDGAYSHVVHDSVRGWDKRIIPDRTDPEGSNTHLSTTPPNSSSFYLDGTGASYNSTNQKMVAWCFRAGGSPSGSTSTTGSAKRINTSGTQDDTSCSALASAASATITPTLMSINQKAGFSIIKYVGEAEDSTDWNTIPHGLNAAPEFVICKNLDDTGGRDWAVYHQTLGGTKYLTLNDNTSGTTAIHRWNNTNPTSSVITIGHGGVVNRLNDNHICYAWHSVAGYSAFGSYEGNGSADGPFIYTGFKPAWVMVKSADLTANWAVFDSARSPYNLVDRKIYANDSRDERVDSTDTLDILSNGFKLKRSDSSTNSSGTYIYAAFAEQPFKYANAR